MFDVDLFRKEFPFFDVDFSKHNAPNKDGKVYYFDSAATALKPRSVIQSMVDYYTYYTANVHRGTYWASMVATEKYENSREIISKYLNCDSSELIFTSGTTEGINIVSESFVKSNYEYAGIVLSDLDHTSTTTPWLLNEDNKEFISSTSMKESSNGEFSLDELNDWLYISSRYDDYQSIGILCLGHASNANGAIIDTLRISDIARHSGYITVFDGAQYLPHRKIDLSYDVVRKWKPYDFYAFSAHKCYGPTGVGVLYARDQLLDKMVPTRSGGGAITSMTNYDVQFVSGPQKFEPGTPNIQGVIGFGESISWMSQLDWKDIEIYEQSLLQYAIDKLSTIDGIEFVPFNKNNNIGILSFRINGKNNNDVGEFLNHSGICVRIGKHCTHPFHSKIGFDTSIRISLAPYNTVEEIDYLVRQLKRVNSIL